MHPAAPTDSRSGKRARPRPAVDERLVAAETRYEVIDGKVEYVAPSDEPHAALHTTLAALLRAHVRRGYLVAVDMLTRTSEKGDMAPDASVYPKARDPETGGRKLEELAFEIVSTERLNHAGAKARALTERGVRKVFAIDVKRKRALTWSRATGHWEMLPPSGAIDDETFARPLPIEAMVDAAKAEDAIASAMLTKKNRVLVGAVRDARDEGKAEGKAEGGVEATIRSILTVLDARGIRLSPEGEQILRGVSDPSALDTWLRRAMSAADEVELLADKTPVPRSRKRRR